MSEEAWIRRLLDEHGVIVQPGYFFDMQTEAYLVVSLITPPADFSEGIRRLRQLADDR
jgi:aspartate/methionine/tyrosine aminotransferase